MTWGHVTRARLYNDLREHIYQGVLQKHMLNMEDY